MSHAWSRSAATRTAYSGPADENGSSAPWPTHVPLDTAFTVCIRILLLLFFAPLMTFIALALYLGRPGPVLKRYRALDNVRGGRSLFVFRTDAGGFDAHSFVGQLGQFLRKSELYKLPQLLNLAHSGPLITRYHRPQ